MIAGGTIAGLTIAGVPTYASSDGTLSPASAVGTFTFGTQTLSGEGDVLIVPSVIVATWTVPTQVLVLAGTLALDTAESTWTVPSQTFAASGTGLLTPAVIVGTFSLSGQNLTGGVQGAGLDGEGTSSIMVPFVVVMS